MAHAVFVQRDAQTGQRGHGQMEVAVVQWLDEDLFGEQQRAEQFGAPAQFAEGGKHVCRGDGADGAGSAEFTLFAKQRSRVTPEDEATAKTVAAK